MSPRLIRKPAAVLLLSLALAGCSNSMNEPVQPVQPEPAVVLTTVEAAPTVVAAGSTVQLTLSVSNRGGSPVTLHFADTCQLLYIVRDDGGVRVSGDFPCGAFPTDLTLQPNETVQKTFEWRTVRPQASGSIPLSSGEYWVQSFLSEHGYESEPVSVRVE